MNRFGLVVVAQILAGAIASTSYAGEAELALADRAAPAAVPASRLSPAARDALGGGLVHYRYAVRVGHGPNAVIQIHRVVRETARGGPAPTEGGIFLMHGSFSTFASDFAPQLAQPPSTGAGLAVFLAGRGFDVWGYDRRWTQAPAQNADLSDFPSMGFAEELADTQRALAFARLERALTHAGSEPLALAGYSVGGQLAYHYASLEAGLPRPLRSVGALVQIEAMAAIGPDDEAMRQLECANRDSDQAALDGGAADVDESFFINVGALDLAAPDAASPLVPGPTNRGLFLVSVAQTYFFAPFTPHYHLAAGAFTGGQPTGLRESPEASVAGWLAAATPHQGRREIADSEALFCGGQSLPVDLPLGRIRIPLFYLGAAGGIGDHGVFTTRQVSSQDVTTLVLRRFGADRETEDFGHADMMFGTDVPALGWAPLAAWLSRHVGRHSDCD